MKILSKLKSNWDIFGIITILLLVFLTNFKVNTWLIGWDNLTPELNIGMNIKRSFLAVWQEYQGLGLVGGMGHASDLIRQLLIWPLTLFLPANLIRYIWHFFCLAFGTFGIYFGLKRYFKFTKIICFLSSLFYLLNFGTIQNFWVPFEPFSTFWAFFPWLIFSLLIYLKQPNRQNLIKLSLLNLLAIPAFYVPTVFIVYLICLSIIIFSHFIFTKKIKLSPLIIIFLLNSFWLLPFFYFIKNDISNPQLALGNQMATEETFLRNQNRGHISDFLILRGYYYDLTNNDASIMDIWQQYFSYPILIIGYLISSIVLLGLVKTIISIKKINPSKLIFILMFFLSAIALLSATPPFAQINYLIRQIPLINQVFRSPFTKFITPAIFSFTVFSAFGLDYLHSLFSRNKNIFRIISLVYFILIIIFSSPIFKGNLFYSKIRQNIPSEYFSLINYFKDQPLDDRVANLPSGDFWGWTNYRFGVNGSGFIWYGIEQPILDRAFDVWNLKNETYYQELNYCLQKKDPYCLELIFQKYSISQIIFDNNVYFPNQKIYAKLAAPTKELLEKIPSLQKTKEINQITVYQKNENTQPYLTSQKEDITLIPTKINNPKLIISDSNNLIFKNTTPNNLQSKYYPNIIFNKAHLIKITHKNISGYPLIVSAISEKSNLFFFSQKLTPNTDWQTDEFVIPQMTDEFGQELTLIFNNSSFTKKDSINEIKNIEIYQIDQEIPIITTSNHTPLQFTSNIFFYNINIPNQSNNQFLVLPQSFHKGWVAFYFDGLKPIFLKNHILFNNWANAWELPENINTSKIQVIFWPQLLEFLGFGLTIFTLIWVLKKK